MSNLEADWGEVKVYKDIPFKQRGIVSVFKYAFRSTRASFYLNEFEPTLILKRLNFKKPRFEENFKKVRGLLHKNPFFISLHGVDFLSEWAPCVLYEKIEFQEWDTLDSIDKIPHIKQLKTQFTFLFDAGFYFKDFDEYNIVIKGGEVIILGWDSIVPIEPNKNFRDYYPWCWMV